jgi:hypothetical protein
MQRSTAALLGLGFTAALLGVILVSHDSPKKQPTAPAKPAPSASAPTPPTASAALLNLDGGVSDDAGDISFTEGFETFPDGGKVPELPDSAPQEVNFGVVQFAYQGAQFAGSDARTKDQAKQKAIEILELAKHDFVAAVAKGDRGSTSDAGRIPRGVLEPPIEYVLFMLEKGGISPTAIDTPRGFWILRRNN